MTLTTSYANYEAARRAHAMLPGESSTMASVQENLPEILALQEILAKLAYTGSGGIITYDTDYVSLSSHIESSTCIVVFRGIERTSKAEVPEEPLGFQNVLKRSVVEQIQELQAALSLNKSQLAQILRVTRPTLYEWFRGKEPNPVNTERLHTLLRCLARGRVSDATPLNARFVRQSVDFDEPALFDLLGEERVDEARVVNAIEQARMLGDSANRRRADREERLRGLGFEDPEREQRREQLARNVALQDWPNR